MKAREIAELVGGMLHGSGDIEITSVADLVDAEAGQLAFCENAQIPDNIKAGCILSRDDRIPADCPALITVPRPKHAFAQIAALLHPQKLREPQIHPSAVVSPSAIIGNGCFIGAFVCIGDGSQIGDGTQMLVGSKLGDHVSVGKNCVLHPNVFVEDSSWIGDRVTLHCGVVIGADGFGYIRTDEGVYEKFPQIGKVVIEDDVEIGANTCIDRAALGITRIGEGTKIDNLVQVGHNVDIGKRCVIAAQTGISGSVVIEDDCVIGGQVGFGDHVRVQSGAVIGSQAGVLPGKIVRPGVWWGTPIQPLDEYKRQNARLKGLGRIKEDLKLVRRQLEKLEKHNKPEGQKASEEHGDDDQQ